MSSKRLVYPDVLRIVSIFAVVMLHTGASKWGLVDIGSFDWKVFNFYESLVRWSVPVFVMLSGMFFLDPGRTVTIGDIYGKYIWRIVRAFVFWSAFYVIFLACLKGIVIDRTSLVEMLRGFFIGHYHLWFLYMIVGLYMITPFLRMIAANSDEKTFRYFFALAFVFASLIPTALKLWEWETLELVLFKINMNFVIGYVGFYMAGYYLRTYDFSKNTRRAIYFFGVLGVGITYFGTKYLSMAQGSGNSVLYSYFAPNVVLTAVAVFVFFKEWVGSMNLGEKKIKRLSFLSGRVFSVYLFHEFFNIIFPKMGIVTTGFSSVFSVPVIALANFSMSLILVIIWDKISKSGTYSVKNSK